VVERRLYGGAAMTREKLEQLPHDPGCRTTWLSADAHCTCTRARALAWVAALETFVAAWGKLEDTRRHKFNVLRHEAEVEFDAARRALAELEEQ